MQADLLRSAAPKRVSCQLIVFFLGSNWEEVQWVSALSPGHSHTWKSSAATATFTPPNSDLLSQGELNKSPSRRSHQRPTLHHMPAPSLDWYRNTWRTVKDSAAGRCKKKKTMRKDASLPAKKHKNTRTKAWNAKRRNSLSQNSDRIKKSITDLITNDLSQLSNCQ